MKKIFVLYITLLMFIALTGCNKKEEFEQPPLSEAVLGGFTEVEDKTITPELKEIFEKASKYYKGVSFTPEQLLATQVVAGTNYKFLCNGRKSTNPPIVGSYFVTVYEDLQGNCKIIDVETVTECEEGGVNGDTEAK